MTSNGTVNPLFVAMRKEDNTYSIQGSAAGGQSRLITVSLGKEDGINTNYNSHAWLLRKMPFKNRKEGKKNSSQRGPCGAAMGCHGLMFL